MLELDSKCESLVRDPQYLLRLYSRVSQCLTSLTVEGSRTMLATFESVDGRYREAGKPVGLSTIKDLTRSIFPHTSLSEKEIPILLHMLPVMEECEETGGDADPVHFLTALREIIPQSAWQMWRLVRKARTVIFKDEKMSPFEQHITDIVHGHPVPPITSKNVFLFLTAFCKLTASEATVVLRYCLEPSNGEAAECLDAELLFQLLFADSVPGKAEYPILAAQMAQATVEVCSRAASSAAGGHTGSIALLHAMRAVVQLPPGTASDSDENSASSPSSSGGGDLDFGPLVHGSVTGRQFYDLCRRVGTGFVQEQSDQLYYYLKDSQAHTLSVRSVVQMYREYFPPVSPSVLQLIQGAVAKYIAASGGHLAFLNLYFKLKEWGTRRLPIETYVRALRESGVPDVVSDISLEWLRLKAPTRVDLILMLCVPVPPSREATIRKLFERLDADRKGVVSCDSFIDNFNPKRIEGDAVRRKAALWHDGLRQYLAELNDENSLSFELFGFFWYMISAAVEDDPTFTMVLWHGYCLSDRKAAARTPR